MTGQNAFANRFDQTSSDDWRALVESSLQGKPFASLTSKSDDGIALGPIYGTPKVPISCPRTAAKVWSVIQRIDDPNEERAARQISEDLAGGANGFELVFQASAAAARTGFGVRDFGKGLELAFRGTENLCLRIDAGENSYSILKSLHDFRGAELTLAYDPLAEASARGGFDRPLAEIEAELVGTAEAFEERGLKGHVAIADGRIWAAGGASEGPELAGIIGSLVHTIRLLVGVGLDAHAAFSRVGIVVETGSHQLLALAKIRALCLLHARLIEAFGLPPMNAPIHAETSWRAMTRYDAHTNILRAASAAFAAGIGGADSLTVLPFTLAVGLPDSFARRVARNLQFVLIEEAGLARVSDPAAGSGAVEAVTAALAENAWNRFRAIEAEGGLLAALRSGSFQRDIATMRQDRAERIARREIVLTGVTEFPMLHGEKIEVLSPRPTKAGPAPALSELMTRLVASRLAEPFERLRDRAEALGAVGKAPTIFLVGLGSRADFAEPAQAATNFFAAGGMALSDPAGSEDPANVASAFTTSGLSVACIAGTDAAISSRAAAIASALKAKGAQRIYVEGGRIASPVIDAVLGRDIDMLAVLTDALDACGPP